MKTNTKNRPAVLAGFKPRSNLLRWNRILVPIDFTEGAAAALDHAIPLARQSAGKLILLHVMQFPTMPAPAVTGGALGNVMEAHKTMVKEAKAQLEDLAARLGDENAIAHQAVMIGVAWDEIVKAAKRLRCDLIVISTHGKTGLMRMLSSSTAEHVVRNAACPVLCVRN